MTDTQSTVPQGWFAAGSNPQDYEFTLDTETFHSGSASGHLKSKKEKPNGFGTLMQEFQAENYRGKRMKFSAFIKSENIKGWSGLWMKVEGAGHDSLAFDNMKNRAISGTQDWKKYEVILNVPQESKLIAFGILLSGTGTVWIDDITFEETLTDEVTDMEKPFPIAPTNLNFQNN